MSTSTDPLEGFGPDWVVGEMPPGYRTRLAEIQRLTADLQQMGRFGRLLYEVGAPLAEAVCDLFSSLKFEAALLPRTAGSAVAVRLGGRDRLLLHVSADEQTVQRKSAEVAYAFAMLHEVADDGDRVVVVTNVDPAMPPAERREPLTADALSFLNRLGASHVTAPTLFALWKLSLQEPDRAREQAHRLYEHDRGTFELPLALKV